MKPVSEFTLADMNIPIGTAAACTKCGSPLVRIWWCDGATFSDCYSLLWWSQELLASHLHNQCERCEREWFSVPIDADTDNIVAEMRAQIDFYKDYAEEEYAESERLVFRSEDKAREAETLDSSGGTGAGGLSGEGGRDPVRSGEEVRPVVVLNQVQDDPLGAPYHDSSGDDDRRSGKRVRRVKAPSPAGTEGWSDSLEETPSRE